MTNAAASQQNTGPLPDQRVRQTPGARLVFVIWFLFHTQKTFPFEGRARRSFPFAREDRPYLLYPPIALSFCPHSCLFFSLSFFHRLSNYKLYWQLTTRPKLVRSFHGEATDDVFVALMPTFSSTFACTRKLSRGVPRCGLF